MPLAVGYGDGGGHHPSPVPWLSTGSSGCGAGCFGMDAARDAGCPSNGCYGKHFVGEISSHIHVSVIVLGKIPGVRRARHGWLRTGQAAAAAVVGDCLCRAWLFQAFPTWEGAGGPQMGVLGEHGRHACGWRSRLCHAMPC